jgi:D-lyxose ketol-isomerase
MKRSFIESRIAMMLAQCARHGLTLPPFAQWTPEQFRADQASAGRIAAGGLGWNIVEFAPGAFTAQGLSAFTVRMGDWHDLAKGGGRLYGEKALMLDRGHSQSRRRPADARTVQGRLFRPQVARTLPRAQGRDDDRP